MLAQFKMKKTFISVPKIVFIQLILFTSFLLILLFVTKSNELAQDSFKIIQGTDEDYVEFINEGNKVKNKTPHQQHDTDYIDALEQQTSINHENSDDYNNNQHIDGSKYGGNLLSNFKRLPEKEYLEHNLADKACRLNRGCQRRERLNNTYMNYCTRYKFENLLSNQILDYIMHNDTEICDKLLDEFIQLDEMIEHFDGLFRKLLERYNCHNGYSVKWTCEDCKVSIVFTLTS